MHAWVYDERAIAMLKTLIPRKSELVRAATSSSASLQAQLIQHDKDEMKRRLECMSQINVAAKDYQPFPPTMHMFQEPLSKSKLFPVVTPTNRKGTETEDMGSIIDEGNDEKPCDKNR